MRAVIANLDGRASSSLEIGDLSGRAERQALARSRIGDRVEACSVRHLLSPEPFGIDGCDPVLGVPDSSRLCPVVRMLVPRRKMAGTSVRIRPVPTGFGLTRAEQASDAQ